MYKRIPGNHEVISEAEAQKLLGVLCVKYGFCLSPLWHARLERNPPKSIDKFADTVFRAEGLDPATTDNGLYKSVREEVRQAFERSGGGQVSGDG